MREAKALQLLALDEIDRTQLSRIGRMQDEHSQLRELRPALDSEGFTEYRASLGNARFDGLVRVVARLNEAIAADESLGEGFRIGHSYFCNMDADTCTDAALASIVDYELIPMLKEYWFDEPDKVQEWARKLREAAR